MKHKDIERHAQAKRAAALARPELGAVHYTRTADRMPDENRKCMVWAQTVDDRMPYRIPFPVILRDGKWINAARGFILEVPIKGWNYTAGK